MQGANNKLTGLYLRYWFCNLLCLAKIKVYMISVEKEITVFRLFRPRFLSQRELEWPVATKYLKTEMYFKYLVFPSQQNTSLLVR